MRRSLAVSLFVTIAIAVVAFGAVVAAGWAPKLGLDLAGGSQVVYKPAHPISSGEMATTVAVITNRVDALGVSGATVGSQGGNVVVQLPGLKNPQAVIALIGKTAQLYFRPVLCGAPTKSTIAGPIKPAAAPLPACGSTYLTTAANLQVTPNTSAANGYTTATIPADPAFASYQANTPDNDSPTQTVLLVADPASGGQQYDRFVCGPSELTGAAVATAQATFLTSGTWAVSYTLTSSGSSAWDQVAQQNFHQYVAIDLDAVVESAPLIQPTQAAFTSFGGSGQISGNFSETTAKRLALELNYGSLPVRLNVLAQQTVSPSLGKSSLKAGLAAGIGGLLLVLLYTIVYYRALGVVVVLGLMLTGALLWAIVSALSQSSLNLTLDLAGVTGLIVSVGITVDSYIVYFERLKDETRSGRSLRTSVDRGFQGAFRTVLAADLVSLAAAVVLYFLAIGTVRGFAFFLGLSTLLDIFTTYFFTRPLVIMLGRSKRFSGGGIMGVSTGLAMESGS